MEPSLRSAAITDPSMRPILDWIDSYVSWEKLPEEVRHDLATRAHAGDKQALEQMVNHNLRLVLSRAVKRLGRDMPLNDLVQEGCLGLYAAARRFNPERKSRTSGEPVQFSTVATRWIDKAMRNATIEQGRAIRLPHDADARLRRIYKRTMTGETMRLDDQTWLDSLARDLSGNPHLMNVKLDYIKAIFAGTVSMDVNWGQHNLEKIGDMGVWRGEASLRDMIPAHHDPDRSDLFDIQELLLELVNNGTLSRREGWMICRHYGLDGDGGRTYSQMARELAEAASRHGAPKQAVSRQRIEQLMRPAMRKLRQYVLTHSGQLGDSTLAIVYSQEQRKGLAGARSAGQSESTASPQKRSATSYEHSSNRNPASRSAAAPTPLRAHDSTERRKGSRPPAKNGSQRKDQGVPPALPYAEAI